MTPARALARPVLRVVLALAILGSLVLSSSRPVSAAVIGSDQGARTVFTVTASTDITSRPASPHYTADGTTYPSISRLSADGPITNRHGCHLLPGDTRVRERSSICDDYGDVAGRVRVALVGDSKMSQWFPAISTISKREGWRLSAHTKSACAFTPWGSRTECTTYAKKLYRYLVDVEKPHIVMLSTVESHASTHTGMARYVTLLQRRGIEVVYVDDNPAPKDYVMLSCLKEATRYTSCAYPYADGNGSRSLRAAHALTPSARFIALDRFMCPSLKTCPAVIGQVPVLRNGSHVSDTYARSMTDIVHARLYRAGVAKVRPPAGS